MNLLFRLDDKTLRKSRGSEDEEKSPEGRSRGLEIFELTTSKDLKTFWLVFPHFQMSEVSRC